VSSVNVAVLVKPEGFICTFSDRNLGLCIATNFFRNLFLFYLYPSFCSISQNHVLIGQYFTQFDLSDLSVYCCKSQYLPGTTQQHTYILDIYVFSFTWLGLLQ